MRKLHLYSALFQKVVEPIPASRGSEMDKSIQEFEKQKSAVEKQIENSEYLRFNAEGIEKTCAALSGKIKNLDFEDKRLALEALQIRVFIDGDSINITGAIPVDVSRTVNTPSKSLMQV